MTDDEWTPQPVPPPERARPIGLATGKPAGIQSSLGHFATPPLDEQQASISSDRTERAKRAWETRRSKAAHDLPDRHYTGQHPYDVALVALREQVEKILDVIKTLEELKGGRL